MGKHQVVDVTPGKHNAIDALATVSFKLGCGCNTRMTREPDDAFLLKHVGGEYPCSKHGDQVITRSTLRLAGWKQVDPVERLFRERTGVRP